MAHSGALTEMPQGFNRLGGSLPNEFETQDSDTLPPPGHLLHPHSGSIRGM